MARIPFRSKQAALHLCGFPDGEDVLPFDSSDSTSQMRAVFALYDALLERLLRLGACLCDGRLEEAHSYQTSCIHLLKTLDEGLRLTGELSENLHILYNQCLLRLQRSGEVADMETVDAVRMVVLRLRRVYCRLLARESLERRNGEEKKVPGEHGENSDGEGKNGDL
ncbi:MAG: flagellar protein FliS [Desulfovibrio sp.]|nr:flagellar protein FliS [Desulfovibrio sp.]